MTDDLAAFVAARLDEDEAAAKAATAGPWVWETPDDGEWTDHGPNLRSRTATWMSPDGRGPYPVMVVNAWGHDAWGIEVDDADAAHIARHDPARVLREVAAKRAILALHHPEWTDYVDGDGIERSSHECAECEPPGTPDNWPCPTLRHLAAVWSDHPDYRADWRP